MKLDTTATPGLDPAVSMTDQCLTLSRTRLLKSFEGLTEEQLHQVPTGFGNSIATILLHVAATEVKFAHGLQGKATPAELQTAYRLDVAQNPLPAATGETAQTLQAKLEQSLGYVRAALRGLTNADLERELPLGGDRSGTVRWMLTVLSNHQPLHVGQIQMVRKLV